MSYLVARGAINVQKTQSILLKAYHNVNTQFSYHAQNLANVDSVPDSPNEEPYRRKIPVFKLERDPQTGLEISKINRVMADPKPFIKEYYPDHIAADQEGYIRKPNINTTQEMTEIRAVTLKGEILQQTYKAGSVLRRTTLDLLA